MSKTWLLKKAQQDLSMEDADYRANLKEWTGKTSSKNLTPSEVNYCLEQFQTIFKWTPPESKNEKQIKRIKYLWLCLKDAGKLNNPNALKTFVSNFTMGATMYKAKPGQLSACIQALQSWCDRENVPYKGQRRG